jgi:hypothetical protein
LRRHLVPIEALDPHRETLPARAGQSPPWEILQPARAGQSRPEPAMGDTAAGQSPPEPARARHGRYCSRPEPARAGQVCERLWEAVGGCERLRRVCRRLWEAAYSREAEEDPFYINARTAYTVSDSGSGPYTVPPSEARPIAEPRYLVPPSEASTPDSSSCITVTSTPDDVSCNPRLYLLYHCDPRTPAATSSGSGHQPQALQTPGSSA